VAYDFSSLSNLLAPETVAVVGASANPIRIGGRPISSMLKAGFKGTILPVNPNRDEIQGLPCYASVPDLPVGPDAAIVAVPAIDVLPVIEDLGKKGCRCVTLFSAGFAELGEQGRVLQTQLIETVDRYGMRLLGPNTLGAFNALNGYFGTFSSSLDSGFPIPGNIGIASQSGAYGTHLFAVARNRGLGASVLVATGNEADITVGDAIGWMAQSDEVEVICAYLEGFNKPERLLEALELARDARKPVFVMKVGRSALGASAAQSHTATLTGDDAVADAVLKEYGAVRVDQTEDMLDFAYCAHQRIYPRNNTMGFITISGGGGIVASDEADAIGLPMPPMPEDAQKELKELLPISAPVNPLDATAQSINEPSLMEKFTRAALEKGGYTSICGFFTSVGGAPVLVPSLINALTPIRKEYPDRLMVVCVVAPPDIVKQYEEAGFLVFEDGSRAVRAIHAMGIVGDNFAAAEAGKVPIPALPQVSLPDDTPDEYQSKTLLSAAGIAGAPEVAAATKEEAVSAAEKIGFPVVMKILSPDILHKSEIGGVRLGIGSAEDVAEAFDALLDAAKTHAPKARLTGILVAKQLDGGTECFMGVNRDPAFGPVAAFGLGGIFVEILNDVVIRRCPFDEAAAREMILSIKGNPILTGARGRKPVDIDALAIMLSRLSAFAAAAGPRLKSIDINPVMAMPGNGGAYMLDAVIETDGGPEGGDHGD